MLTPIAYFQLSITTIDRIFSIIGCPQVKKPSTLHRRLSIAVEYSYSLQKALLVIISMPNDQILNTTIRNFQPSAYSHMTTIFDLLVTRDLPFSNSNAKGTAFVSMPRARYINDVAGSAKIHE